LKVNYTGWGGFVLFAGIGLSLYLYLVNPLLNCYVTPIACFSIVHLFYFPLGVAGYLLFSHHFGRRDVAIFALCLLAISGFARIPSSRAQPLPLAINPLDYAPYTYWVDKPQNVSFSTVILDEFYVYQWAFFWPYHPVSIPSTCAPPIPTNDWELVYEYISYGSQQVVGVAYRFHCNWSFISAADPGGVIAVFQPGVSSPNATKPVITFLTNYHVPVNDYPGGPRAKALQTSGVADYSGSFVYNQGGAYNYTGLPSLPSQSSPVDPAFFRNTNWQLFGLITAAGLVVWPVSVLVFFLERKKLSAI